MSFTGTSLHKRGDKEHVDAHLPGTLENVRPYSQLQAKKLGKEGMTCHEAASSTGQRDSSQGLPGFYRDFHGNDKR